MTSRFNIRCVIQYYSDQWAKAQGLPSPTKVQLAYTCKKCCQPQNKETGHSQYYGQTYCPYEEGQIPKSEWLKQKAEERKAKKSANL